MLLQVKDEATTSMKTKTETTITTTVATSVATTKMNGVRTQNAIYKQSNVSLLEVFAVCFTLGLLFAIEIWSLSFTAAFFTHLVLHLPRVLFHFRVFKQLLVPAKYSDFEILSHIWCQGE